MLSPGTLCSLLLLSVFWADLAMAGSSFLSPEHQKTQSSPESTVLTYQTSATFEWSSNPLAKSQETFQEVLGILPSGDKVLRPGLTKEGLYTGSWYQFNAPFDVGIKLPGAQYQQHARSLGKLLQDILWEEAKEAQADSDPPQD